MTIYTLQCDMIVQAPIEETFKVFEDPYNLARITPPWLHFTIATKNLVMKKGAVIEYRFRWLGIPQYWRTLITEYEPPHSFVDEAQAGPYAQWRHTHRFEAVEGGTRVSDTVVYAMPLGVLGRIAHRLVVRSQLERIFKHRQEVLRALLGTTGPVK